MADLLSPDDALNLDVATAVDDPFARRITVGGAADAVTDRLVTAVALGIYVPGQRLPPERELAGMLEVSRTTVREGLRRLVADGYLEVRRGRTGGYFVLSGWGPGSADGVRRSMAPRIEAFEAFFDARRLIEGLIASTAAARRTEDDLTTRRAAAADYRDAVDREASRAADARLHAAVAGAAANPLLLGLSLQMRARVSLNLGAEPFTEAVRHIAVDQHDDLVAAIADADAGRAGSLASAHFGLTEGLVRDLLARAAPGEALEDER